MIVELIRRMFESSLHFMWQPREGDRIEYLTTPQLGVAGADVVHRGDRATITRVSQTNDYDKDYDIDVLFDDGRAGRDQYFRKNTVKVIAVSRSKAKLTALTPDEVSEIKAIERL